MSVLRDISLILLALEGAVLTLAIVVVLAAINYGLFYIRWWQKIPYYFSVARSYLAMGQQIVERVCRAIAAPVYAVGRFQATLAGMLRGLTGTESELDQLASDSTLQS